MRIAYRSYELQPLSFKHSTDILQNRSGALLKVTFPDGVIGYSDCHPWEQLGDASLPEQLSLLKQNRLTSLTERSLHFARLDGEARDTGISLFHGLEIPKSHYLIPNLIGFEYEYLEVALQKGFHYFKVKVSKLIVEELELLKKLFEGIRHENIKFRLDFNCKLTPSLFETVLEFAKNYRSRIDFFEDPFIFEPDLWKEIQDQQFNLACDYQSDEALPFHRASNILVLKPAVQDESKFIGKLQPHQKLVVTSYLDHPLGQSSAAYVAAKLHQEMPRQIGVCGLLSHLVYRSNSFSEHFKNKGPDFRPAEGTGFGFDELLENTVWDHL